MRIRYMDYLRDRQDSRDESATGRQYRSRAFNKYFEGYVEYREPDVNGRMRIKRVYRGLYYIQDLNIQRRILLRILYVTLFVACAALFVYCASRRMDCNTYWYVAAGQCLCMIGLVWAAYALCNYLFAPQRMTIGAWRSAVRSLQRASLFMAAATAITALMTLLYFILHRADALAHLYNIGGYLLCTGLMLSLFFIERRVPYQTVQSADPAPEYAEEIG